MKLNDAQIRRFKQSDSPQKFSDGGGLHLVVTTTGSKLWRFSFRHEGKQKTLAFGAYPAVSLAVARDKHSAARRTLASGTDPSLQAKLDKLGKKIAIKNTFAAVADDFLAKAKREGRAEATLTKKRWLLDMAKVDLGTRPIADISAREVLEPLRRVEALGNHETARRLRATIGQVFRFAIATTRAENDPTFGLKGALTSPTVVHRAAITNAKALRGLLRAVWEYEGHQETRAALQLMALLYPRPGELRFAEWPEFDLEKAVWTIPAARTKMRREHRKPLSPQAVRIVQTLETSNSGNRLVFPSVSSRDRPLSENTMNAALRRLGFTGQEMTSHGFRATASTILNESGLWSADAIEAELAHVGADQVRRAYHRGLYWDERVRMAAWWADHLDSLRQPTDVFA